MTDLSNLTKSEKTYFYIKHARPVLNEDAMFADGTGFYRTYTKTQDGYNVRLRFRTARDNAESVRLVTDTMSVSMKREQSDRQFDYYEAETEWPACGREYYFEITGGRMRVIYNKRGPMRDVQSYYNFHFRPEFKTPDWAKGAVFYQIFVDRFNNGDRSNDVLDREYIYLNKPVIGEKNWSAVTKDFDVGHFYGGDIKGIWDKLDYLQDLGVEVIYLNPVFVSPSNHKYDTQDYDYIDPHLTKITSDGGEVLARGDRDNRHATCYMKRVTDPVNLEGSNEFFAEFIAEVHRRGMKIILDGVFNHCGSFNKWMDKEQIYEESLGYAPGAYEDEESPFHSFFRFMSGSWPFNDDYDGWWGHETLPKLNYEESESLKNYIISIGGKWVSPPYCADGWRLDVAADLGYSEEFNHQFWREFRDAVKQANPDAIILAEHYTDPAPWLKGDEWDTVMNYQAFMEPVTWFLTGMEKHSDEYREDMLGNYEAFETAMSHHMSRLGYESLYTSMNELSNHDHSRFLTRTNGRTGRIKTAGSAAAEEGVSAAVMREAVIIQMTWPGAPTVYYGDEAGVCGWTDPDSRRTYPWGHEDQDLLRFHKEAIRIHKESSALRTGSFKMLCGDKNILAFGRFDESERIAVVVNNRHENARVSVPVWELGVDSSSRMVQLLMSSSDAFCREANTYTVKNGSIEIDMPKTSAVILREGSDE